MSDTIVSVRPYIIGSTRTDFIVPASAKVLLGDAGITATRYFGLRAYSTATIGVNAVRLRRISDLTVTDIKTVAGGGLDYAAINAFDDGSTLLVNFLYNQTGTAQTLAAASDPTFNKNGGGFQIPTMSTVNGAGNQLVSVVFPNSANPFAFAAYANHTAGGGTGLCGDNTADFIAMNFASDTELGVYQNNNFTSHLGATITSGAWHGMLGLFNGANSAVNIDGADTTGTSGGTNTLANASAGVCGATGFGSNFGGSSIEFAFFDSTIDLSSPTTRSLITNNMKNWWGL